MRAGKNIVTRTPGVVWCGGGELRAAICMTRRSQPMSIKGKHMFLEKSNSVGEKDDQSD